MATLTNQYPSLKSKVVFITGGGSGIGECLVEHFVRQGAQVAYIDIDESASQALNQRLTDTYQATPWFRQVDVRDIDALQTAIADAASECGRLDVLINNAGKDDRHKMEEVTPDYWDNCLNINMRPHFFGMQAAAKYMSEGSSIINMGSISWMRGRDGMVGYTTSKGAIHSMTRTMARELGPKGIRVNSIVPGAVVTERQKALWLTPELDQQFIDIQSLKFRIQPDDIVAMALFLGSNDSRACAGQNFIIDAGIV
ncbi:SDR family NAD(P)-dependent oxidoreductase [Marinomonas sp. TW1]|uniref:SDR family NAD(P)-dependent oxidoreductase n=1 Tax=Marinomonas sp. TW1 TaxID=1561203 RepID=UPI0007AF7DD4|nr:SDR family oxidoreductase [Marinomonas sp. TW1]KZN13790.1 3-oxoacyl-ACP reductase [Marinomonas sp. TW1]